MIYLSWHLVEAVSKQPIEETQAPLECPIFMEKYNSFPHFDIFTHLIYYLGQPSFKFSLSNFKFWVQVYLQNLLVSE